MRINPKILEVCQEINTEDALLFCFAVSQPQYDLLDRLLERGILDENEQVFRIKLCTLDDDGNLTLRYPLYTTDVDVLSYEGFCHKLVKEYNMTVNGHINNRKSFKVMDAAEEAYKGLLLSIPDLDMDRLCRMVSNYYETTEFCTGFSKFFASGAKLEYETYQKSSGLL